MSASRKRFQPKPRRLQRSGLARVRELTARRKNSAPKMTRRASRLWALASVGALILLVMAVVIGRQYAGQKLNVEQTLRTQLIPSLEKQLGQKIEVGKIESDYFSRIILSDVVIGRDAKSPVGALMQAKRVTISLDAIALVMRRSDPLEAISKVALESPQLYLERDQSKHFNLSNLFKTKNGKKPNWRGLVEVQNGRLYYRDQFLKGASGQMLLVDAHEVSGRAQFNGDNPIAYTLQAPRAFAGKNRELIRDVKASGTFAANTKWLTADIAFPQAPAVLLADYAFRKKEMTALGGLVGVRAKIMWDAALPEDKQITATGVLELRDASGFAKTLTEPGTTRPLFLQKVNGPLRFTNKALETSGVSAVVFETPLSLAGNLTLAPPIFNIRATSNNFNGPRLMQAARAMNRSAELQNTKFDIRSARGEVRIIGEKKVWSATGKLFFPQVSASNARFGAGSASTLATDFSIQNYGANNFAVNANFSSGSAKYASPKFGKYQANGNLRGAIQINGDAAKPNWQLKLSANSADASSAQFGVWRASGVSTLARSDGQKIVGQIGATKLAGRQNQLGVVGARGLNATINGDWPNLNNFSARIIASSALGSETQTPQLRGVLWQTGALRSTLAQSGGAGSMQISAANLRARQNKNAAQAGTLRGFANWNSLRGATIFSTKFETRNANIQSTQAGNWRATYLTGLAQGRSTRGATNIQTDIEARHFSGSHARYGSWNGAAIRVAARSYSAAKSPWSGVLALGRTDVSRVNFGALSPEMAARIRDAGVLTGKARFSNLPGKNAVIKGRARLTKITLNQNGQNFLLQDVDTQIAVGGNQFRLAGLRANSNFGPLLADAQSTLSGGPLKLSLVAPNLVLTSAQINPYLAASGVKWQGEARGSARVSTVSSPNSKTPIYQTQFDFAAPSAQVLYAPKNGASTPLRLSQSRVRGAGAMQFTSSNNWKFSGGATLSAAHLANADLEDSPFAGRVAGLKLNIAGNIARNARGFAPRLKGELSAANLVLPLDKNSKIAFQNTRASFQVEPNLYQLTRFEMFEGADSKVTGHASLRRTQGNRFGLNGQLLAEKFDAARLQKLVQNLQGAQTEAPQLAGVLYARADFSGRYFADGSAANPLILDEVGVQARLYRGRLIAFNTLIPIDVARLSTTLQFPLRGAIPIDQLLVWSGGSRIGVNGVLTPARSESGTSVYALDLDASVNTLRVRTLRNISALRPAYQKMEANGDLDGLISGQLHLSGTTSEPKIEGRAALKLAQAYGLDIEEAGANVSLETSANSSGAPSFRVALKEISGRIEGSRFSGNLDADSEANLWNLSLQTDDKISTNRLLHLAQTRDAAEVETDFIEFAGPSKPTLSALSNLPLRGELGAVLNLSGTLRNEAGSTQVLPREGTVLLETSTLRWRGRDLGALNADLRLQNGVLQARQFELKHQLPDTKSNALLRVSGVLPVSLDTPDLDATVTVENEELSFVLEVLQEINRSLSDKGQKVVYLDSILKRLKDLPSTLEGRFDMQAQLEQSWRVPVVEVRSLQAREVSFRNASGIQQRLPDVTARFIYDGNDNGAVAIQSAELRLPADARKANAGMTPEAIAAQNAAEAEGESGAENSVNDNDLLIRTLRPGRIVPGGEISLAAEIINADLQKLAEWIPALRDESGGAALKGQLSDFVLQVAGTTGDPTVTGSLQGENWQYGQYSLDRVRLDRFSIGDGKLQVEPGFLTVVKGDFQSDAAWGNLSWTWGDAEEAPGVSLTGPLDVHLPIDKENFGALAGIFVPQIINVGADAFSGEVTIGGTLNKPQLAGQAQITNGTFRVRSSVAELDAGVANISGAMKIVNGNQLQISGDGLTGKLVTAGEVKAPETGNPVTDKRKASDARRKQKSPPPTLAGDFRILGSVAFDLEPQLWREPRRAMSSHRYDLKMSLVKGRYATPNFSGVRDVNLAAVWKTGAGEARNAQEFKYALIGVGDNNNKAAGQIVSSASFQLSPEFAVSANELLRAKARTFFAGDSFHAIPIVSEGNSAAPSVPSTQAAITFVPAVLTDVLREAEGKPSRAVLRDFRFDWKNVARGFLGGELNFDNRAAAIPPAPPFSTPRSRPRFYKTALQTIASRGGSTPALENIQGDINSGNNDDADNANFQTPLRVAGKITLTDAELFGAPATREISDDSSDDSGDASGPVIGVLSRFPDAPRFDVDFEAGRNVQFVSSNLRATITGTLDLGGTPRDPILFGTVFTKSGSITFPNARARLETGEITITARRDPVADVMRTRVEVDATARGRSGRYDFTIRLRGPLDTGEASTQDLRVDISSNPSLSTDEAFAQLLGTAAFNRGGTEGHDQEPYVRALVGVLSGPLFSGLERSLERTLGLTNIELNYSIDEAIGIEVGKAVGERLYISYRRALSSPSGQKTPFNLRLEYRIKGDLQLGIETDETQTRRFTIERHWRF